MGHTCGQGFPTGEPGIGPCGCTILVKEYLPGQKIKRYGKTETMTASMKTATIQYCAVHKAAPDMQDALVLAKKLANTARLYFPKSMQNSDRFMLESTNAAIYAALTKTKMGNHQHGPQCNDGPCQEGA